MGPFPGACSRGSRSPQVRRPRRKKREATVSLAYEFVGLESVADIRRLLEIAATDTLGQENNLARNRLLVYLALAALQALEKGDHEQRIAALEQSVNPQNVQLALPVFDVEAEPSKVQYDKVR